MTSLENRSGRMVRDWIDSGWVAGREYESLQYLAQKKKEVSRNSVEKKKFP